MRSATVLACVFIVATAAIASASITGIPTVRDAEPGRHDLVGESHGTRSASLRRGRVGLEVALAGGFANWEVSGPESAGSATEKTRSSDASGWPMSGAVFYGMSEHFDIRAVAARQSYETDGSTTESFRVGVGGKVRFPTGTDYEPFVGASVNYYPSVDATEKDPSRVESVDGGFGLALDLGVSYMFTDAFALSIFGGYELTPSSIDARVADEAGEYSFSAFSVGLGVAFFAD